MGIASSILRDCCFVLLVLCNTRLRALHMERCT
ncbi:hypothetical protein VPHK567_0224 [Vibrio phage K567]